MARQKAREEAAISCKFCAGDFKVPPSRHPAPEERETTEERRRWLVRFLHFLQFAEFESPVALKTHLQAVYREEDGGLKSMQQTIWGAMKETRTTRDRLGLKDSVWKIWAREHGALKLWQWVALEGKEIF